MKKIVLQIILIVAVFFLAWQLINQVNWMKLFKVEQISNRTEEKLGDIFWDLIKKSNDPIDDKKITGPVDSLLTKICEANNLDRKKIKLHVLNKDEVNAFAMPNNHLVVYSGLITASDNEGQLSGVIAHEVAHLQMNHVMKKMVKEVGLSVLISIAAGNGGETVGSLAKTLTSTAYDRKLEKEADLKAVEYMREANMNPEHLANFLYKLTDEEISKHLVLISTHPATKERAEYIVEASNQQPTKDKPVLAKGSWEVLQSRLKTDY